MACSIQFDQNQNKIGVLSSIDNKPSKLFSDIFSNPHIKDFEQALDVYLNVDEKYGQTPLKYQSEKGLFFNSFREALKVTNVGGIAAGIQTEEGFKELFSIDSNINPQTYNGMLNNLIKEDLLSGESYIDADGQRIQRINGNSAAKKAINSDITISTIQKYAGIKGVKPLINGDLFINPNYSERQIALEDKTGEIVFVKEGDLNEKTFPQLKREFSDPEGILAAREFKNATSVFGEPMEQPTFIPENELQVKLMSLLNKMGVKTMEVAEYVEKYGKKNAVPPSAQALADLANNIVAFKDGVITQSDLTEETSHFIVAATPLEQKTDLKRNIHKTPQWAEYQQSYRDIYGQTLQGAELEDAVREEILGKVLAESLQNRFAAETDTQKGILNKLQQIFTNFFNKIASYFTPQIQQDLNTYSNNVYANLMNDTLNLYLNNNESKLTLFSVDRTKNDDLTLLYNKSAEALDILTAQQNQLAKGRKLSGTREELKEARELNQRLDEVSKTKALAGVVAVAKKQLGHLERAVQQNKNNGFPFSQEENAVYQTFVNHTEQLLSEIGALLNTKGNKDHALIKKDLQEVLQKSGELKGKVGVRENTAISTLMDKIALKHNLTAKEREDIEAIMKASQKDTSFFQANLGTLVHARNPFLNLAGDTISRVSSESRQDYLSNLKKFTNAIEESGVNPGRLKELRDESGRFLVSEIDFAALQKAENEVKTREYNSIKNLNLTPEEFKKLDDANNLELTPEEARNYNIFVNNETSKWKEQFFTDEYLDAQTAPLFEIAGDFHKKDRAMRAEIRANATVNGRTIYNQNDKTELEQLNKKRAQAMNPRDPQGNLKRGLIEIYNTKTEQYEIELDENVINTDVEGSADAFLAYGLMDIAKNIRKQFEDSKIEQEIPQAFLDEMNKLDSVEDKLEFLYLNAYVGFPDSYWENFGTSKSLLQKLQAAKNDENSEDINFIASQIRKHQQRIAGIQKGNRTFNAPSETNVSEMTLSERTDIKDAAQELEALYQQANKYLEKEDQEDVENLFETRVNQAYQNEIEDRGITTQREELDFIQQNVTFNNRRNIDRAIDIAAKLKKGEATEIPKVLSSTFNFDMTETEVDEALMNYSKSKLLPYYKRTEPIGFTDLLNSVKSGEASIEEMLKRKDLIKVSPNFSFYDNVSNKNINPVFLENKLNGRPQIKKGMFESQKFKDLFGAIKNNTPEKNADLYKAYTAIIDLQKTTLENYGLDGKQNPYKLPQIGKRGLRQAQDFLQDTSSRPWKETLKELTQFRTDTMELGSDAQGNAATKKMRANIVPMYYTRDLEDQKDVTDELLMSYSMMASASSLYKARIQNLGDMLSIKQAILNSDIVGKSAEASNTYKMFSSFLDHGFFGIKETFSYQADIFGYKVDLAKVAKGFNNFIKTVNLTGITVSFTSLTQGEIQRKIESVVGERINPIAAKLANKEFLKLAPEAAGEILDLNSKAKLNVLGEAYGMYQVGERFENSNYSKFTRGFVKSAQATHAFFNFPILPRILLTSLADQRYFDGKIYNFSQFNRRLKAEGIDKKIIEQKWQDLNLLYDDIYVEKGVQKYNLPSIAKKLNRTEAETDDYIKEIHTAITNRVKIAIQDIDSAISEEDRSLLARNSIANFFLTHRSWLLLAIQRKFKDKHTNFATGEIEQGNWLSTYQLLRELTAGYKKSTANAYLEHIKQVWETSDETTRRNLTRTLAEIGFVNILVVLSLLLSNYLDDEPDSPYALQYLDYMLYRTTNEQISSTVTLPQQIAGVLDSPIVGIDRLYDIKDYMDFFNTDTLPNDSSTTKQWRMIVRSVPGVKDYDRLANIKKTRDTYEHFNKANFDYVFTTYLLSKEK